MRTAIWRTNDGRCFFCEEAVPFRELEIDHLIPRVTNTTRLSELMNSLDLPNDFHLDHLLNLVPTHGACNRRKGSNEFTEATGDLYLSALVELGLILFLVTFIVNGIARVLVWNVTRKTGGVGRAA